jgi:hypothetical protein
VDILLKVVDIDDGHDGLSTFGQDVGLLVVLDLGENIGDFLEGVLFWKNVVQVYLEHRPDYVKVG